MKSKQYSSILLVAFFLAAQPLFSQPCNCTNCPVSITDNGVFSGFLDVTVNGPNDLGACPLVQVCFTIQHTWIGDLSVSLTSPGGQNYLVMADNNNVGPPCGTDGDNIDICITPGTGNPLTNNTDYMCNPGPCAVGNCCLTGLWTVPCNGVTDPNTGGIQAPTCDLNDFNVPGSPANGTWTLKIADNCAQDVGLLLDWSLVFACGVQSCFTCESDGGELATSNVQGCFGDPNLFLSLPPSYPGTTPPNPAEYGYTYVISQNGTIIGVDPGPNMTTQPPGTYEVCGFSYYFLDGGLVPTLIGMNLSAAQAQFSGFAAPFCGDFSDDCIEVLIGPPPPPGIVDTMLCIGDCIIVAGQQVCNSTTLTVPSWLGCDSLITVVIIPIPPTTTEENFTVCEGDCVTIGNDTYCPPGPHSLFYTGYQGCDSIVIVTFEEISASAVITPDPPNPLTCTQSSVTLDGSGSSPQTNMEWIGPDGVIGSDPVIVVTEPGDYTLTVINDAVVPPCEDSYTVTVVDDSSSPDLEVLDSPEICEGESFDLSTLNIVDNNGTSPSITFHIASPAVPSNELPTPMVMPTATTTYYILGDSNGCTDEISVELVVNAQPTSDFTVTTPICVSDFSTIEFTGTASLTANYDWDFGGGTANPGVGPGPHDVSWDNSGTYTITLTVDENGCISEESLEIVQVDEPLADLEITCGEITLNSVEFIWETIPGAIGYTVNVLTGQSGTQGTNCYEVTGLAPGEEVEIEVIAIGDSACGEVTATHTCVTDGCEDIQIEIDPVADICLDTNAVVINLLVTVMNSNGTGTGIWSGEGIVDENLGTFDPAEANLGTNTLIYTFTENNCEYSDSIQINIIESPIAFFTATNVICISDSSLVTYDGNASPNATYTWNFDGGSAIPGTGQGPHLVNWTIPGPKTITLIVEENDCISESFSLNIIAHEFLPEPVLNCNTTLNSIEFFWNDIPNSTGYNVTVLTGQTGDLSSDTSFLVNNLTQGEIVTIELTVFGNTNCPNTIAELTCEAQECPMATVEIDPISDICLDGNNSTITLNATQMGANGGGTFMWSGDGIVDADLGIFDPNQANIGTNIIQVAYSENGCNYNGSTMIQVTDQLISIFDIDTTLCSDEIAIINYTGNASSSANFTWNFSGGTPASVSGPGPHQISWDDSGNYSVSLLVEESGCMSELITQDITVSEPIAVPVISCNSNTTSIEFIWNSVPNSTGYNVNVLNGTGGVANSDTSYLFDDLNPNDQITIQVEALADGICPNTISELTCTAQDCPDVTIEIDPVADICLDDSAVSFDLNATQNGGAGGGDFIWSGDGIVDPLNGTFDPNSASVGMNTVSVLYQESTCTYNETININVFAQPTADFTVVSPICVSGFTQLTYTGTAASNAVYDWTFDGGFANGGGQGPFAVDWTTGGLKTITLTVIENGCISETMSLDVQVDEPLDVPNLECVTTTSSVEFFWPNDPAYTGFLINVLSGQLGNLSSDTSYLFENLSPDEEVIMEIEFEGMTNCGSVIAGAACMAQDCPDISIDISMLPLVCLTPNVDLVTLEVEVLGSDGSGEGVWSGDGIIDSENGIFDPSLGSPGSNEITYAFTEQGCDYQATTEVEIIIPPTANFNVDSPICIEDFSEITFTGTAQPGTTFNWNFGNGNALPGGDVVGPHEITWTTAGQKTISLTTTDVNGCVSEMFMIDVIVEDTLPAAVINCNSTTESIEFSWNNIPGVSGFSVNVTTGQLGNMTSDTSILISSLDPNEEVTIEVISEGGTVCGFTTTETTCLAIDCPKYTIEIDPVDDVCLAMSGAPAVTLSATGLGVDGTTVWSGTGIISPVLGVFDPVEAGLGMHEITLTYTEDNCFYIATTMVNVVPFPTADFTVTSPICEDESATVTYTGTGGSDANLTWNFNAGVANPGFGVGPHQVEWLNAGTKTISLIVEENGCISEAFTQDVVLDVILETPTIECNTDTESIEFFWNDVPNAVDYVVTVINGPTGALTSSTSYSVTGLNPLDEVTIQVEVVGNNACPNPIVEQTCEAFACPDAIIEFVPVEPICFSENIAPLTLQANVSGTDGGGNGSWSGEGISNANLGVFDANMVGVGIHEVTYTYEEGNCIWSENFSIQVTELPMPEVSISDISCFGTKDGALSVTNTTGGTPPYLYGLNGGTLSTNNFWTNLSGGNYDILVQDANGCENTLNISLIEPQEVNVELVVFVEDNTIILGDSVDLVAQVSINPNELDNVVWEPAELVNCDTCLTTSSTPFETTNFTVTVDSDGCSDSDDLTIFVRKERPIYVPNGFSPNGDGVNDVFMIFSGDQVEKVKSFLVFNRWGEPVFQFYNIQTNDPNFGWDGTYRGEPMNPAVFVWFAEIEFIDGSVEIFKGDVTLTR